MSFIKCGLQALQFYSFSWLYLLQSCQPQISICHLSFAIALKFSEFSEYDHYESQSYNCVFKVQQWKTWLVWWQVQIYFCVGMILLLFSNKKRIVGTFTLFIGISKRNFYFRSGSLTDQSVATSCSLAEDHFPKERHTCIWKVSNSNNHFSLFKLIGSSPTTHQAFCLYDRAQCTPHISFWISSITHRETSFFNLIYSISYRSVLPGKVHFRSFFYSSEKMFLVFLKIGFISSIQNTKIGNWWPRTVSLNPRLRNKSWVSVTIRASVYTRRTVMLVNIAHPACEKTIHKV